MLLLAGHSETPIAKEVVAQPAPVHAPALTILRQAEHSPVAAHVHHDQTREINVDFPEESLESGVFVLMVYKPQGLLKPKKNVELGRDPLLILRSIHSFLIGTEDGDKIQGNGLGRRGIPFDRFDPRELRLDLLERQTREHRNLDRELAGVEEEISESPFDDVLE